jgi:hypothetical protein
MLAGCRGAIEVVAEVRVGWRSMMRLEIGMRLGRGRANQTDDSFPEAVDRVVQRAVNCYLLVELSLERR